MRRPKSPMSVKEILFYGRTIPVKNLRDKKDFTVVHEDGTEELAWACYNRRAKDIKIATKEMISELYWDCIIHETLHACEDLHGKRLDHEIIGTIGADLSRVFHDNRWLWFL